MSSCCRPKSAPAPQVSKQQFDSSLPVAIIGGGPVGLAAAAHLIRQGLNPVIFEAEETAGAAPLAWGHVHMFSSWQYNIDRASRALLERQGWSAPDADAYPTGRELVEQYLLPLARTPEIAGCLRLGTRVTGIARIRTGKVKSAQREQQPFEIRFEERNGEEGRFVAGAVIVATGTWGNPAPAGASGLSAIGEKAAHEQIRYGMPDVLGADRKRYASKKVLVIGSGHSAIGTLIDLARLATQEPGATIVWAMRRAQPGQVYGGGDADQLPERGALGQRLKQLVNAGRIELLTPFAVDEIRLNGGALEVRDADGRAVEVDELIVATGLRPELQILREVRLDLDAALECPRALAPLIDPNLHSCGTVRPHGAEILAQPDTGLYIAGMASYGRAPTFLMATGYEQVRSIAAWLAGDIEAARRVELELPETGVCSTDRNASGYDGSKSSCCAPTSARVAEKACCAAP
ncbi:NAD(P)-binding domain-containing protein [Paraburkholderia sp. JPY169]|uniref:NAD(P)-binding domain-containing protein n=1 Tax=Paraburkholderia youngii TaxID=2782701 RepID=A0A7Y6JZE3_9BURK|nr:NAD(P)-binding domain-containing protein [Paraburkholderia youngii]